MKICQYCDSENADSAKFCAVCGGNAFKNKCNNCGTVFESAYCPSCGTKAGAYAKICPRCRERYFTPVCPRCGYNEAVYQIGTQQTQASKNIDTKSTVQFEEPPKKKVTFGRVLLWIFFLPIMAIITVWQAKKLGTIWKIVLTVVIVAATLLFYYARNRNGYETVDSSRSVWYSESSKANKAADRTPIATSAAKKETLKPTAQVTAVPETAAKKETPKPTTKVTTAPKKANQDSGGGSKEFRAMLDEYEKFIDSLCKFMDEYNNTKDVSNLYMQYLDWMKKYAEWVAKIDDIDVESLSEADYRYFIEVTTRCSNKIIKAFTK